MLILYRLISIFELANSTVAKYNFTEYLAYILDIIYYICSLISTSND